jgi:hypothetical protein
MKSPGISHFLYQLSMKEKDPPLCLFSFSIQNFISACHYYDDNDSTKDYLTIFNPTATCAVPSAIVSNARIYEAMTKPSCTLCFTIAQVIPKIKLKLNAKRPHQHSSSRSIPSWKYRPQAVKWSGVMPYLGGLSILLGI